MPQTTNPIGQSSLLRWILSAALLLLILKLVLASLLDLYSDEVFYWLASANPALAYSDLPFVTALLIGLGSALDPANALVARLPFLLLGTAVPLLVYWVARGVTDSRDALLATGLSLCLPLGGFLGLLAVPDVPLIVLGLASIGTFERALRCNDLRYWIATGVVVALGFSTHYRFALYPAAAILFLLCSSSARNQWRNPRLWLSLLIASVGLIPILWFNLSHELSSASFYLVDRHPWEFQASGLLHVFKQAGLVTPPLYALLGLTLWLLIKRARQGDTTATLFVSFSAVNIFVYLLLAPWTDATSTSIHWPLSGYFPLLPFAPATMRVVRNWCQTRWSATSARRIVLAIPVLGFAGTVIALLGVGSQAFQLPLQSALGTGVLSNKMAGWKAFHHHTDRLLADEFPAQSPVIITDNYYTAAQLEFAGVASDVYTLDRDKAVRDGRITQFRLWGKDESGLAGVGGRPALVVTEDSTLTLPDKDEVLERACTWSESVRYLGELRLFNGDKRFSFYRSSRLVDADSQPERRAQPCPFSPRAWIDSPQPEQTLQGQIPVSGWSYNEDLGVDEVQVWVDDTLAGIARYGLSRPDVVEAMGVNSDPNRPALGYEFNLDTSHYANGSHRLHIRLVNTQGIAVDYGAREIFIDNAASL